MSVWLRRQEAEAARTLVLARGIVDLVSASGGSTEVGKVYQRYLDALLPFTAAARSETDKKMAETLSREIARGPIRFQAENVLRGPLNQAKALDKFKKLLERQGKKTGL